MIDRILFDDKPSLEVFSSASLMHLCSGKRCYFTPALTFGLTRDQERREVFNLLEIMRVRIEVPDAQELIRNQDRVDRPALVVVDGVGIGRAIVQELSREMRHLLPGGSFDDQNISGLKVRRFHNAMPPMYDGLLRACRRRCWVWKPCSPSSPLFPTFADRVGGRHGWVQPVWKHLDLI